MPHYDEEEELAVSEQSPILSSPDEGPEGFSLVTLFDPVAAYYYQDEYQRAFRLLEKMPVHARVSGWVKLGYGALSFSNGGSTLVHLAAQKGDGCFLLELLKRNANPNVHDGKGYTPLARVLENSSQKKAVKIIHILLCHGATDPDGSGKERIRDHVLSTRDYATLRARWYGLKLRRQQGTLLCGKIDRDQDKL